MFDEFIKEIKRLEAPVSVSIDLPLDQKGYLDRLCPHEECRSEFKVLYNDWRDKVSDALAVCPKCGLRSEPSTFNTHWQEEYIRDFAREYMSQRVNGALSRAARRTPTRRIGGGLLSMQMAVSFKAGPAQIVLPPSAAESLRQDLTCEPCGCRYSTIGAGYFCPACGDNSAMKDFERTIDMARKTIDALPILAAALSARYDEDAAANFEHQLLEDQIENLVTAFQRGTEFLFSQLSDAASFRTDNNLFQRLDEASAIWAKATGRSYIDIIGENDHNFLQKMIQRRHKIGHSQGMVDAKYLQKSGDCAYSVGQRLVTTADHVDRLAKVLEQLLLCLRKLVR